MPAPHIPPLAVSVPSPFIVSDAPSGTSMPAVYLEPRPLADAAFGLQMHSITLSSTSVSVHLFDTTNGERSVAGVLSVSFLIVSLTSPPLATTRIVPFVELPEISWLPERNIMMPVPLL